MAKKTLHSMRGRKNCIKKRKVVLIQGTPGEQSSGAQNLQNKHLEFLNLIGS